MNLLKFYVIGSHTDECIEIEFVSALSQKHLRFIRKAILLFSPSYLNCINFSIKILCGLFRRKLETDNFFLLNILF